MIGESNIELGATYRDTVSGFEGVVVCSTRFLFACERVSLSKGFQPDKGEEIVATFDAAQLEYVAPPKDEIKKALERIGIKEQPKPKEPRKTGGDRPTPSAIR